MIRHALLLSLALGTSLEARAQSFQLSMDGQQLAPPVVTAGSGYSTVDVDQASATVDIIGAYQGLSGDAILAHLHTGAIGTNGPVIATLATTGGTVGQILPTTINVTAAAAVAIAAGNAYIDVHTTALPTGELRGQILNSSACGQVSCGSGTSCSFSGGTSPGASISNTALGNARLDSAGGCSLVVSNLGSSGLDGVRMHGVPPGTDVVQALFSCPNMIGAAPGAMMTMHAEANVPGGIMGSLSALKVDPNTIMVNADYSAIGATSYSVTLMRRGAVVAKFTGLPQATVSHDDTDQEEVC